MKYLKISIDFFYKKIVKFIDNTFLTISLLNLKKNLISYNHEDLAKKFQILVDDYEKEFDFEKSFGFKIEKDFILNLAKYTKVIPKKSELNIDHGRLLYSCLRSYIKRLNENKINIIETGTAMGFSSLCMSKALLDSNFIGQIYTFDIIPHNKVIDWKSYGNKGEPSSRRDILYKWSALSNKYINYLNGFSHISLSKIYFDRIHFAFLDGSHYGHDIDYEFSHIVRLQQKGDIVVFDDYNEKQYSDLKIRIDKLIDKFGYNKKIIEGKNFRNYVIASKK
ncbi:MAG: hypothetical protein CMI90_00150 [Pelagibacteraceae bacterium]|nr:hypothetical protein [Pelagibacteraceae bacterium]|tara:strand:- start:2401 stop:3237 length:837 start_codon:yes stop_codon:yes gene_type:complete